MEKLFNKLSMILVMLAISVTMVSCGDDDEPPYDPENPAVGAWIVEDVYGWDYHGYIGQLLSDRDEKARQFAEEWMGKTIKVTTKNLDDDTVIISDSSLHKEYLEIESVTENQMHVYYVYLDYFGEGEISSKTTASMLLKRK